VRRKESGMNQNAGATGKKGEVEWSLSNRNKKPRDQCTMEERKFAMEPGSGEDLEQNNPARGPGDRRRREKGVSQKKSQLGKRWKL